MRGRIAIFAFLASASAGLFAVCAETQAKPPVKIYNGAALAAAQSAPTPPEPKVDPIQRQLAAAWSLKSSGLEQADHEQTSYEDANLDWTGDDAQSSGECGASGCDCGECAGDGCDCDGSERCSAYCGPYGLSAGVEATYLKPSFESNGFGSRSTLSMEAAPRVWLQWQTRSPWGIRGRFWDYDAEQQLLGASDDGNSVGAAFLDDDIELYAVDLELTRNFQLGEIECCASFGARNGRLKRRQTLQLTTFDLAGGGGDDATVISEQINRGLDGTGITLGLGLRRPIMQSRLALICNLRGSVLWGPSYVDLTGTLAEAIPVGVGDLDLNDFSTLAEYESTNASMWIGELQAGGEWSTPIADSFGGGDAILRLMFEAQWWNLPGITTAESEFDSNNEVFKFIGLTAAVGFTR